MTRYRFRGIFLLLLMGHATACASSSWQTPGTVTSPKGDLKNDVSVPDYIEEMQPGQVRITLEDGTQIEMEDPVVVGGEIVSADGLSVPIADIVQLEVEEISLVNPKFFAVVGGLYGGLALVALLIGGRTDDYDFN